MFTLTDGRDYLYQWDINRSVRVSDPSVTEVHFCNRTGDCSLVTKVYANPTDSELYADIPNILLQSPFDIRVFAYCDGYTKVEETFKVKARTKPDDYVYTETEILQYSNIVARMDSLEDSLSENLEETVNNYLDEHPVQVDLTGYAKEEYVDTAISNIKFPEPDLTNYATKDYVTDQIDYYTEDFATTGYVEDKIAEIGEPDLTGYATESWVRNQGYINHIPADYVTETELNSKGYATKSELGSYAFKYEIPEVPTKVSQLENDKGYLTKHQSLDGYATHDYVDRAIANIDVSGDVDLSDYYTKEQTYSKVEVINKLNDYAKKTDIPSLDGYAKETYVDNAIQEYDQTITQYVDDAIDNIDIPDVDLSNYYTKAEVDDKTKKDSFYLDLTGCTDTYTDAPADVVNFATEYFAQKCEVNVYGRYSGQWGYLPLDVTYLGAGHIDLRTTVRMQRLVNGTAMPVYHFQLTKQNDVWRYKVTSTDVTIATKEYVDGLFAGIATAEERSY